MEEKQRLTLIERQTLLAYEVKRKQTSIETSFIEKQKETRKPIFKQLDQPILKQIEKVKETQTQPLIETLQKTEKKMTKEGEGYNITILTPEQRIQYERQQREWQRKREKEIRIEVEIKREKDEKREYDNQRRNDIETYNDQEDNFGSQF